MGLVNNLLTGSGNHAEMARDSLLKTAAPLAGLTFLAVYNLPGENEQPQAAVAAVSAPATVQSVYYRYCSDVRNAGAAPWHAGEPGYAPHLDRDGDGVACEPYRGN